MIKQSLFVCAFFLMIPSLLKAQTSAEQSIRAILSQQEAAWNRADLRAFMKGYWESDSMLFLGKKGPTYGYTATLNNYLKSYPDTAHTGRFTSKVVQLKKLSKRYYLVVGSWHLQRSVGDVGGYYSLLFRKIKGRWYIVMDHTS